MPPGTLETLEPPQAAPRPILQVAVEAGFQPEEVEPYGHYMAKIPLEALARRASVPNGKLIYTTAITATPAGEGKTTMAIGLVQALGRLGKRAAAALREPSMGPVFGIKGGATGGGLARIIPAAEINLHFTGDIHAVGAAHNLLAALIDNHIHQGNELGLDPRRIVWPRVLDVNDRALRHVIVGLGGPANGVPRETRFDITVASEIMAILCLADGLANLKERLGRILVGYTYTGQPVYARDLGAQGAMAAVLAQAMKPNLVQTLEGQPAFVHGGPFANIAHGNNSVVATRLALKVADYVVTEGGFAADLGAEKFFDIVHGYSGLVPDVAVLVASVRALRMHGGAPKSRMAIPDAAAVRAGLANLDHHVGILRRFGLPVVVAINRFDGDSADELKLVADHCAALGVPHAEATVVQHGGAGGETLAKAVLDTLERERPRFRPAYEWHWPIKEKIDHLARTVYGADGVDYTPEAEKDIAACEALGAAGLPVCVAKTQHSTTDQPQRKGAPRGWRLQVRAVRPNLGAGFLVCLTGDVMTMPGLPHHPSALDVDVSENGTVRLPF
ncbi:MAG: formate--tetrahydrofolate ligase [Firmicutes bacterium ZCTH02-B6]|nr:MAG: formate--tetrahydrofolate ligase [Firmicutes bacterium ZCTH02-B6]